MTLRKNVAVARLEVTHLNKCGVHDFLEEQLVFAIDASLAQRQSSKVQSCKATGGEAAFKLVLADARVGYLFFYTPQYIARNMDVDRIVKSAIAATAVCAPP